MESISDEFGNGAYKSKSQRGSSMKKQEMKYEEENSPRFGGSGLTYGKGDNGLGYAKGGNGERFVIKKTSKSHNEHKNGRVYVVSVMEIIYNDGHIEKVV